MSYKYKLDTSSKKFYCPKCNNKRFVKFIDNEGVYLSAEYGRCDRIANCSYFNKPDLAPNEPFYLPNKVEKPLLTSFIDKAIFEDSMKHYDRNAFYQYLTQFYKEESVLDVFAKYNVGTSQKWGGSTVFWQMDGYGKLRSGKIMKYDKSNGKRVKKPKPLITWVHSLLQLEAFNLKQVLFGQHLVKHIENENIVCIVESEKTAIICSLECPDFCWIATGSFQMFKTENMKALIGKRIIVFPDTDTHDAWNNRAKDIEQELGIEICISEFLLNEYISSDRSKGYDLADLFLDKVIEFQQLQTEVQIVINGMIKKNKAIKLLIDKFDLDIDNAKIVRLKSN